MSRMLCMDSTAMQTMQVRTFDRNPLEDETVPMLHQGLSLVRAGEWMWDGMQG